MFSRPNLTEPIATGKHCGLRFKPFHELPLIFPNNCFFTKLNNSRILDTLTLGTREKDLLLSPIESRIHGGRDVLYHESPWTVQIMTMTMIKHNPRYDSHCTGTLITSKYILTAGHCLEEYEY